MRIKGRMSTEEFENVCNNIGITNTFEISKRYSNYLMGCKGLNDGRSNFEVGVYSKNDSIYDED